MARPKKEEGTRARDIAPIGIRLPQEVRDGLVREAAINGRSLNQEVLIRLRDSLQGTPPQKHSASVLIAQEPGMTDLTRMLLGAIEKLDPQKQLALLTLLKR